MANTRKNVSAKELARLTTELQLGRELTAANRERAAKVLSAALGELNLAGLARQGQVAVRADDRITARVPMELPRDNLGD